MKEFLKNFLICMCLTPAVIAAVAVVISPVLAVLYVHNDYLVGLLLLIYIALMAATIITITDKYRKKPSK